MSTPGAQGPEPEGDLTSQVRSGLSWSFGSNIFSRITTLVTGVIMARLLAPEDFGVFAVAMVAMTILVNINDLGLEQSVVRWPGDIARVAPTAVTVIFGFSAFLCAACLIGAGPFSRALGAPEATPIVRLLALGLIFNGAFAVPSAILTREFRQDKRTYADLTGFVVGTVITLVLAVMGFGPWALAWGRFIGNAVVSLMHVAFVPQRFRPGWDGHVALDLLRSGLPLGGATLVAVALLNIDYMFVGRLLGTEELGYYTLAFNLASWPVTFFAVAVARVSVPAFARLQHDRLKLQAVYDRSSLVLLAVTLPSCLLLAVFANPLIRFVYGDKWAPAVTVLRLLAGLGLLRVLYQFWADVFVAVGAGQRTLLSQLCWLGALVPGLVIGVRWGLTGVGLAHILVAAVVVGPVLVVCLRGVVTLRPTLTGWAHLAVASTVAGAAGSGVLTLGLPRFWTLAVGTLVTLGVYTTAIWPLALRLGFQRWWLRAGLRQVTGRFRTTG